MGRNSAHTRSDDNNYHYSEVNVKYTYLAGVRIIIISMICYSSIIGMHIYSLII